MQEVSVGERVQLVKSIWKLCRLFRLLICQSEICLPQQAYVKVQSIQY